MLNFKQFYEYSQISQNSNAFSHISSQQKQSNLQQRSKSSHNSKSQYSYGDNSNNHGASILQTKSIIEYNINDFMPKDKRDTNMPMLMPRQTNANNQYSHFNVLESQPLTTNVFKQNFNQNFQQQSRIQQQQLSSPCSCSKQQNLLYTQRSSVCSCQYSQSSASQSQYASPHSNYSKHRPVINNNNNSNKHPMQQHSHQQSQCSQHFQSCGCSNCTSNSCAQLPNVRSAANFMVNQHSNENTPFKSQNTQQTYQQNNNSKPNSRSPIQKTCSNNQLFEDRSISFLKSSNKKGYNTDDLIRDSESEVDLNEVSTILQEVQINFQEGFNQILKSSQANHLDRVQREELAMKILHQNLADPYSPGAQGINDSQLKTLKSISNNRGPVLTLDALLIPTKTMPQQQSTNNTVLTPVSLQNFNFNSQPINHQKQNDDSRNQSNNNHATNSSGQSQLTLMQQQQQYMSPCFNQFEESNQNLAQQQMLQLQQSLLSQYQSNGSGNNTINLKQNYNSVPAQDQKAKPSQKKSVTRNNYNNSKDKSNDKQMTFNNKKKQTRKKKSSKLQLKKSYSHDQYSQQEQQLTQSSEDSMSDKENQSQDSSSENNKQKQSRNKSENNQTQKKKSKKDLNKSDIQKTNTIVKVLKEMSIQTSQSFIGDGHFEGTSSFLDKSDIQIQAQKPKVDMAIQSNLQNEVITQQQQEFLHEFQSIHPIQNRNTQSSNIRKLSLPPAQRKDQHLPNNNNNMSKFQGPPSQPIKQIIGGGCSIPNSKNSTLRTPQNHHFQSQSPHDLEDYLDDESSIQHQQSVIGHSSAGASSRQISTNNAQQYNHQYSNQNLLSPYYYPHGNAQNNFDHFKSQCSEVIIRGSSETDISNKIARYQMRANSQRNLQQNPQKYQHHSHQISGCQSIVNHDRSQFTSLESNSSPNKRITGERLQNQAQSSHIDEGTEIENQLHTGETFMKHQQEFLDQQHQIFQTEEELQHNYDSQYQNHHQYYQSDDVPEESKSVETYSNFQRSQRTDQYVDTQNQEDEEFNYTVNLNEIKQHNNNQQLRKASLPPMYGQRYQSNTAINNSGNQHHHNHHQQQQQQYQHQQMLQHPLNNTSSTAGFPQLYGYVNSQQTGRRSTSLQSSFQSQNISNVPSQTSLHDNSYRSVGAAGQAVIDKKKMSFMDKIILIQYHVKKYLNDKQQSPHLSNVDSINKKPLDDSISHLSSSYLNTYKQYLNTSSNMKVRVPNEQTYQKNIMESLNLTTGNTFIKENRQLSQAGTQPMNKEKSQAFGNSSALVLFSGSTQDNRINGNKQSDNLMMGQLESQPSMSKAPQNYTSEYDFQMTQLQRTQQSPTNNTSLLNLTEESNSAIFKLTPMASQNVTQKTNLLSGNFTGQMHNHEKTTESNNLNYSYSELDSEWVAGALNKDNSVSPMSVNTTSNRIQGYGGLVSRGIHKKGFYQRSSSIYSDQLNMNATPKEQSLSKHHHHSQLNTEKNPSRHTQKIRIESELGGIQSPMSQQIPQVPQAQSAKNLLSKKQVHLLSILKSQDYDQKQIHKQEQKEATVLEQPKQEWKLLKPIRENDLKNLLVSLVAEQMMGHQISMIASCQ